MITETAISVIIYSMDKDPKFLLLKYKVHGQKHWDFVKGKLEQGEGVIDAAKRETLEETNISDLDIKDKFREEFSYMYRKDTGEVTSKTGVYLLAEVSKKDIKKVKISEEHEKFKWVDYDTAEKMLEFDNQKDIMKKVKSFLGKKK